jgi:hypothetical protein
MIDTAVTTSLEPHGFHWLGEHKSQERLARCRLLLERRRQCLSTIHWANRNGMRFTKMELIRLNLAPSAVCIYVSMYLCIYVSMYIYVYLCISMYLAARIDPLEPTSHDMYCAKAWMNMIFHALRSVFWISDTAKCYILFCCLFVCLSTPMFTFVFAYFVGAMLTGLQVLPMGETFPPLPPLKIIKPETSRASVELIVLGLRELLSFKGLPVQYALIEAHMGQATGRKVQRTSRSKRPEGANPNYGERLVIPFDMPKVCMFVQFQVTLSIFIMHMHVYIGMHLVYPHVCAPFVSVDVSRINIVHTADVYMFIAIHLTFFILYIYLSIHVGAYIA